MEKIRVESVDEFINLVFNKLITKDNLILSSTLPDQIYNYAKNNDEMLLGYCYFVGLGCEKDKSAAYEILINYDNHPMIQYILGIIFFFDNPKKSFEYFIKSADAGISNAMPSLAYLYYSGQGVIQSYEKAFEWYLKAANLGDVDSMFNIGNMYYHGQGVIQSYEKALEWYLKAANLDKADAMANVSMMYYHGQGVIQSYEKAFEWCLKVAKLGNVIAMVNIGNMYFLGQGVIQSYEKAFNWCLKAANLGNVIAMFNIGKMYYKGQGAIQSYEKAFEWYLKASNLGNVDAMVNIVSMYYNGQGAIQSYEKAFNWCLKAANLGNVIAMVNIGNMYYYGQCVIQSYEKAFEWYLKASNLGNVDAMYNIGKMYYNGQGAIQSYELAFKCNLKAANLGNVDAMYNIGSMYYNGRGVMQSYEKAFNWCLKASNFGNVTAMYVLANLYYNGRGVIQSYEDALKWYLDAANLGNVDAMKMLGYMYYEGKGVTKSYEDALKWFKKAYEKGYEPVLKEIEELEEIILKNSCGNYLNLGPRQDVFISWNHKDQVLKNNIVNFLEKGDGDSYGTTYRNDEISVFDSDRNASGELDKCIEKAINDCKIFIVIVTKNSFNSYWVKKEISMALKKVDSNELFKECIRPIYLDDAEKMIEEFDDENPFKKISNLCGGFSISNEDLLKLKEYIKETIKISIKAEFQTRQKNNINKINVALVNYVKKKNSNQKTDEYISLSMDFIDFYIDRPLYDREDAICSGDDIFNNKFTFIHGEGGSGKSLFLKNLVKNHYKGKYYFYIEAKNLDFSNKTLSQNIKDLVDSYFNLDEKNSIYGSFFDNSNDFETSISNIYKEENSYILIDALDEMNDSNRRGLFKEIKDFVKCNNKSHFIFTSRVDYYEEINSIYNTKYYKLKGFNDDDINTLLDKFKNKLKNKINIDEEQFKNSIKIIEDDIKTNPLLISNLLYIYIINNKLCTTKYQIIENSIELMFSQIENEKDIINNLEEAKEYITCDHLEKILCKLSYCGYIESDDHTTAIKVFEEYLDLECHIEDENEKNKIAREIYNYLSSRAIIEGEKVRHKIFLDYFAATKIYNDSYKEYIEDRQIVIKNEEKLNSTFKDKLSNILWAPVTIDFILKYDSRLNAILKNSDDLKGKSKNAFDFTLKKVFKETNEKESILKMVDDKQFYFGDYIKKQAK